MEYKIKKCFVKQCLLGIFITIVAVIFTTTLSSCQQSKRSNVEKVLKEWKNKEIIFPDTSVFTVYVKDTATLNYNNAAFKIVSYVDLSECSACKLNLASWKQYISELNSVVKIKVPVLIYIYTKDIMTLRYFLRRDAFCYPVCVDTTDTFNRLNKFEKDERFQTLLLNRNNRVIAVGNPATNPQVKQMYFSIFADPRFSYDSSEKNSVLTMPNTLDLGEFDWTKLIKRTFEITNNTKDIIRLSNISSSCECLKLNANELILMPKSKNKLHFEFKAERAEGSFYREIVMYDQYGREYVVDVTGISD